jgi:WD40 repeat protein
VRVPFGVPAIVLVTLASWLCYVVGPSSIAPARRAWLPQEGGLIWAIAFTPGGGLLAATNRGPGVSMWEVDGFERAQRHFTVIDGTTAALSPDGSVLAIGADAKVMLCDTAADARRIEIPTHMGANIVLAFSRDGKMLAVAGDRSLTILDTATGHDLAGTVPALPGVTSVVFSPDGHALATGDNRGQLRIWDLTTGQERAATRAHNDRVSCLDFSSDGRKLVSASIADRAPRIWDATTCRPFASLRGHSARVQTAAFS